MRQGGRAPGLRVRCLRCLIGTAPVDCECVLQPGAAVQRQHGHVRPLGYPLGLRVRLVDVVTLREGLKLVRKLDGAAPLSSTVASEILPWSSVQLDEDLDA